MRERYENLIDCLLILLLLNTIQVLMVSDDKIIALPVYLYAEAPIVGQHTKMTGRPQHILSISL